LDHFFKTGQDYSNSISISTGTQKAQTYFSYANTTTSGIQDKNKLERNNFFLRETSKAFNDKLSLDGSANIIYQKINNVPIMVGAFNPLPGLYLFPRGLDIGEYKNNYEIPDADRGGLMVQNWPFNEAGQQNPWWVINRDPNFSIRNRVILSFSAKYDLYKWINFQVRGNMDRSSDRYEQHAYAGTSTNLIASPNGQLKASTQNSQQIYGDALINFHPSLASPVKIDFTVGASIKDEKRDGYVFDGGLGLFIPNVFIMENVVLQNQSTQTIPPSGVPTNVLIPGVGSNASTIAPGHNQIQSVFFSGDISLNDYLFLSLSGRNDWSSNLAFTPNGSYFYPSAGLSLLLNGLWSLPESINYGKLRASFAQVGNTVATYATNPQNILGQGGAVINNGVAPLPLLKPEKTNSVEFGMDWRFFDNRLTINFTHYKANTKNQFFQIKPATTTGYSTGFVNAGDIQNSGNEITIGVDLFRSTLIKWNSTINISNNKNVIKDVDSKNGIDQYLITAPTQNYESSLTKGGSYGDIYGYKLATDESGRVIIGSSGLPSLANALPYGQFFYAGNPNAKFLASWANEISYKKFQLNVLIDGHFGGQMYSWTQSFLDRYGVSTKSAQDRDNGGVKINGVDAHGNAVTTLDPQKWYSVASQTVSEYIYSATVVRLREISLGYRFDFKHGFAKGIGVSLIGRNLIYFYKKAPSDPELSISSGNGLSGLDYFNPPAIRSYGVSVKVNF